MNTAEAIGLESWIGAVALAGMALGAVRLGWITGSLTIKAVPPWQRKAPERRMQGTEAPAAVPIGKDRAA